MSDRFSILQWAVPIGVALLAGCAVQGTRYAYDPTYSFRGKTVGLCVIVDRDEQEALSERRVVRRSITSVEQEGYAGDPDIERMEQDVGDILPPERVGDLDMTLIHSRYYDEDLVHPVLIPKTTQVLEAHGFPVRIVPVPDGEVELKELAERAKEMGCDLLAVETVSLVRSWNVQRPYFSRSSHQLSTSFRWQKNVGGMVLINMSMLDLATGKVVWEHAIREVKTSVLGPLLGELYDERMARTRFARHPGRYQGWLYRKSAERALHLLFATLEEDFHPLPYGSDQPDSIRRATRYETGQPIFVRPTATSRVWHAATVASDTGGEKIAIRWTEGIWPAYAQRTSFPRADVMPRDSWPPIVWVRAREKLEYTPYRFVKVEDGDRIVRVDRAGDLEERTYLIGRVGIIPE